MYPLLLDPPIKNYIWGGRRLIDDFKFNCDSEKAAEAWLLSCHFDGESAVKNGSLAGLTLSEAIENFGDDCLGENGKNFSYFPLLIKLIDAKDRLSLQVHPDDEYALRVENEYGKNEMWYIVDCEENAKIVYGLKRDVTAYELETRIRSNSILDICNLVPVKKGDAFFIPAGTLHAIGKGILIAEVQQNSNTTYRVSDYGRIGADGRPRELHVDKALDVINRSKTEIPQFNKDDLMIYPFGTVKNLVSCDLFTSDLLELNGKAGLAEEKSFLSIVLLDGDATLSFAGGMLRLKKGDSVFVPAKLRIELSGKASIICSHV